MKNTIVFGKTGVSVVSFAEAYASAKTVKAGRNARQTAVRARRAAAAHAVALPQLVAVYTAAAVAWAEKLARRRAHCRAYGVRRHWLQGPRHGGSAEVPL